MQKRNRKFVTTFKETVKNPSERYELLDGMRFMAALAVLFYHFGFRVWNMSIPGHIEFPFLGHVMKYGYLGVDVFFMISGFVILMTASKGSSATFMLSRIVRLYPAYWCCVVLTFAFVAYVPLGTPETPPLKNLLANLTMLQSAFGVPHVDASYWTLVVELQFYALILLVLSSRLILHIDRILALWLLLSIASDFIPGMSEIGKYYAASWCQYFVAGAFAYRMRVSGVSAFRLIFYGLAFLQATRHAHWYMTLKERITGVPYESWVVQAILALTFGIFFLLALGRLRFRHSSLSTLGSLTYPLYLIHGLIGSILISTLVHRYNVNHWSALAGVTAAALGAAWIIQRHLERPIANGLKSVLAPWFLARR